MSVFYLDTSAWVKYYTVESGSDWMERFWQRGPALACSKLGLIELTAALVRRGRQPHLLGGAVDQIVAEAERHATGLQLIPLSDAVLSKSRDVVLRHALRGADGIHLGSALYLRQELSQAIGFVASGAELLSAAAAEGFATFDPEAALPLPEIV